MILSDTEIESQVGTGNLGISPFIYDQLQAASYDVRLARHFRVFDTHMIGVIRPDRYQDVTRVVEIDDDERFVIQPGEFALASTIEHFSFPSNIVGRLEGKSSLGRLGLIVHATAGFFDPGFQGFATLELHNVLRIPIELFLGMPIAQMSFLHVKGMVAKPYAGKYQGQSMIPAPSEYWRNFRAKAKA